MNEFGSIQVREGDLLAGKYRIERVLGVGGMGVVFAARHEQLEQLVAIKFVRDDALQSDGAVERFLREARSAARLRSEHVARVLDVGRLESGAPYMVMEFLDGADLAQTLTRGGPMAIDLAASLMIQVCEAVAEAHAAGIVHRDLKPENLFLTRTIGGTPKMKVLDFGVSKSERLADDPKNKLTATRTVLGSPLYMAPEQMRSSRDVDARGDVWALGVVLFELLTGRSPFEAETMPGLCLKIVAEPPLSLAELRPAVVPALVEVVERCLEKDRNERYANAGQLALALAPFAQSASVVLSERPSPRPPRILSIPAAWGTEGRAESQEAPPRRGTMVAWAVVVALAIGAAAVAFALSHGGPSPDPAKSPARRAGPPPSLVVTDMPSLASPPPAVVIESPGPAVPDRAPVAPSAASAVASSDGTALENAPPPGGHAARSAAMPPSVAATLARPDDDIPSLR